MSFAVIGAILLVVGYVMGFDVQGLGTKWREIGMRYYDRGVDAAGYEKNTRRFRIAYRLVAAFGLVLLLTGLISLL